VLGTAERQDLEAEARRAVSAWLSDRSQANRRAAIDALQALDDV
jgi:hypothetical protein